MAYKVSGKLWYTSSLSKLPSHVFVCQAKPKNNTMEHSILNKMWNYSIKKHGWMEPISYNIWSIHNIQEHKLKIKPRKECSSGKVPLEVSKYPCSDIQLNIWRIYLLLLVD